ncbi:hypothetical protein [Methanobacterium spitsbergense]|uniref:Uncharacterized protein n=1 Tax=Methanobacterium spitsbergense TaxID=2874285 RepID=A0A8T5UUV5_9EURY|nr:hypothetical protein [Methanobacterium spitsbergense]MBZ2164439.1 hypothetical protein [Methanobacterium spitsbergense]
MDNGFGMNIEVKSRPIDCKMNANSATNSANSALCDRTDCPSYGKWYCPFTGW